MSEESYYVPGKVDSGSKIPVGEYRATICELEVKDNQKCGAYIADVFKPVYRIDHSDYTGLEVKDNGVFRYKSKTGYDFKPSRNWGFAKLCSILELEKKEGGKITLPYLELDNIYGFVVTIDVAYKKFTNNEGNHVSYPVATLKKKLKEEVPF